MHSILSHCRSLVKHYHAFASRMTYKGESKLAAQSFLQVIFGFSSICSPLTCVCLDRVREGVAVQHFTFVLTDLKGSQRFGFCRLTSSTHTCLCILRYIWMLQSASHAEVSLKHHYESCFLIFWITVISHGLRCSTNFSTTWLIISPKDRWVCVAHMYPHSFTSIIHMNSFIFSSG